MLMSNCYLRHMELCRRISERNFQADWALRARLLYPACCHIYIIPLQCQEFEEKLGQVPSCILYFWEDIDPFQSLIIHSACGGVSLATTQLAQIIGAEVYASFGNEEKVKYPMESFKLPRN